MAMNTDSDFGVHWKSTLNNVLPLFGHRNWIVVADSAYPAQSNPGIETIATRADHVDVLNAVLSAIDSSDHVRPKIYVDRELQAVSERDAKGITNYRQALEDLLAGRERESLPHEQIIKKLDECASLFRTLILKSTLAIPYTSVFLELDCGYWSADAEQRLRRSIAELAAQ
jgi:L-fucose mutarotase/ribose pyranase (RbsD/FucU family)